MHLEHHGVKGQKWGVRRYQNKDGTLTEEGWYAPAIILNPSESIKETSRAKIKENNYRYDF